MSREADIELNCREYTTDMRVIYTSFFEDWQEKSLTENDVLKLVADKQAYHEMIGLNLFQEGSDRGVTFLAKETSNISLCLDINRKKLMMMIGILLQILGGILII